jgi:short-subunit dehydrogenase
MMEPTGHTGIGYETTYQLAIKGARVYIGGRSQDRVKQAIEKMNEASGITLDLHFLKIDLENLKTLKEAVQEFSQREACLDLLINNAGVSSRQSSGPAILSKSAGCLDHEHPI